MGTILYKRRVFAFEAEATPGTPMALTSAQSLFCFDPMIQAEIPMHDRVATGSLSKLPAVPGARKGKLTVSFELAGGGTTPQPGWAPLLNACGMVATGNTYNFTSNQSNLSTVTVGIYEDGRYKSLAGCQGTFGIEGEYGKPAMIKFDLEGIWQPPTTTAMVALPSYAVTPPRFAAATFALGSFTPKISKFSVEAGNTTKLIEDITQASAYSRAIITDRNCKGKIDPAGELVSTWDAYGLWIAGGTANLNAVIGSVTNNTITINAPQCQTTNVQEAQRELLVTDDLDFLATATSAGDNEMSIAFS
jgi:hypothetical protein